MNCYEILQIEKSSNLKEIKNQYKILALKYHPDKCNLSSSHFVLIQKAYEILSNSSSRENYDKQQQQHKIGPIQDQIHLWEMEKEDEEYYFGCRCGGFYIMTNHHLQNDLHAIECTSCSLFIYVKFEESRLIND